VENYRILVAIFLAAETRRLARIFTLSLKVFDSRCFLCLLLILYVLKMQLAIKKEREREYIHFQHARANAQPIEQRNISLALRLFFSIFKQSRDYTACLLDILKF